jgi:hypothetical protein
VLLEQTSNRSTQKKQKFTFVLSHKLSFLFQFLYIMP